jgi:U3 small nucleolar RNA-associated protein 18
MSDSSDSEIEDFSAIVKSCITSIESERSDDGASPKKISANIVSLKKKRRRLHVEENEKDLNSFLFGDKDDLIKNLEGQKTFFLDAGRDVEEATGSADSQDPVWHDSDDDEFIKLKGTVARDRKNKKLERIGHTPKWADLNWKKDASESEDDDDVITKSVGFLDKKKSKHGFIPKGDITFKRVMNLNRTTANEGVVSSIEFHPKSFVGIVTGRKGLVSIFAVDGRDNKKIHNICYDKFVIHACKLTNDGDELIIGGQVNDMHVYNLMSGYKQRVKLPRGMTHMKYFQLSPCGKYIAVIGDFGEVHLLHAVTKELLFTYKQEHQSTSLNFSSNSNELYSHSDDNEVTIFDIRTQRVKHRFVDDGCVNGTVLSLSPNGRFLATGSRQGFVNIYNSEDVAASKQPKPLKVISNLTTEITDLRFNHTSELLAMCSIDANNALKLLHVESGSVFKNFPSHLDVIGKANVLAFSPESGYLAVGTMTSKVPLYRLNHYKNY